jgi:lysophospholipase L1-like esterase
LHLAKILNARTRYVWRAVNLSTNGHTARDLWFRLSQELWHIHDVYQACVLIGTNDVGTQTPVELFEEYYRQILNALRINGFRVVYCGEIPPIWPDGHAFFRADTQKRRDEYNERLRSVVEASVIGRLVPFPDLTQDCYTDPVHLNEKGNERIAQAYADAIVSY